MVLSGTPEDPSEGIAVLPLLFFSAVLLVVVVLFFMYSLSTIAHSHHLMVRVRMPYVIQLDLLQTALFTSIVCVREIAVAVRVHISCTVMNLMVSISLTSYLVVFQLRAFQLLLAFSPGYRLTKNSFRRFRIVKTLAFIILIGASAGAFLLQQNPNIRFCKQYCQQPNCFWGSNYYLVMPCLFTLTYLTALPLILSMYRAKIQESVGITTEFKTVLLWSCTWWFIIYICIILVDRSRFPMNPTYSILSFLIIVNFGGNFAYGHVIPARKYGYSPDMSMALTACLGLSTPSNTLREILSQARAKRTKESTVAVNDLELSELLNSTLTKDLLLQYSKERLCEEAVLFLIAMRQARDLLAAPPEDDEGFKDEKILHKLHEVYDRHLSASAPYYVSVGRQLETSLERAFLVADVKVRQSSVDKKKINKSMLKTLKKNSRIAIMSAGQHPSSSLSVRLRTIWSLMDKAYDTIEAWVLEEVLPGFRESPSCKAVNDLVRMELSLTMPKGKVDPVKQATMRAEGFAQLLAQELKEEMVGKKNEKRDSQRQVTPVVRQSTGGLPERGDALV